MSNAYTGTMLAILRELAHLESMGGKTPQPIKTAQALHKKVKAAATALPSTDTLRNALIGDIADGNSPTPEQLNELSTANLNHELHAQAIGTAEMEIMAAISANADSVIAAARDTLFTPAVEALASLADRITPGDTVDALLRARRTQDATDMALAAQHLTNINLAHRLRALLTQQPARVVNQWKDAETKAPKPDDINGWLAALRNGVEPWLPTADEAEAAHAEHVRAWQAERELKQAHHSRVSMH
ncbi:hypothetical protein [[Micrococcus luteus] ATCC 49442]|uniref:hypothetical protein n=1 Tax=[Micrococcus luteus] ATCC 49442 TaxID=2698727 RepID=UPI0013DBBC15|nr:hypothetical protein [[Micrococcus luteus] ATCC 49442]